MGHLGILARGLDSTGSSSLLLHSKDQSRAAQRQTMGNRRYLLMEGTAQSRCQGTQTPGEGKDWAHFGRSAPHSLPEACLESSCVIPTVVLAEPS